METNLLSSKIRSLCDEKNAVILAHYYQVPEIQEVADFVGDSLALAKEAARTDADIIVFAGVHFMAETAKLLNPEKLVLEPEPLAGCSLDESCPVDSFQPFVESHPDHEVVTYVNSSVAVKALTDICCTSSNAVDIINAIPKDKPILFAPDKNLGAYLQKECNREMLLWDGACTVHEAFCRDKIQDLMLKYPEAHFIAHPESEEAILEMADYIGSTKGLLNYVGTSAATTFIVATEAGILYEMKRDFPTKKFIAAPINEDNSCACSECEFMKMNSLEKVYNCLLNETNPIYIESHLAESARKPIEAMLNLSKPSIN